MKNKYTAPEVELTLINRNDIITTSGGTQTPIIGEGGGSWEW